MLATELDRLLRACRRRCTWVPSSSKKRVGYLQIRIARPSLTQSAAAICTQLQVEGAVTPALEVDAMWR